MSLLRAAIPTHVGARACAGPRICARTRARASAAPPRTTARAASTTRRARPACGGAPPGRKGGAYIVQRGHTRGVPRADVCVERRRPTGASERLRDEPHVVHAGGTRSHVSARMRGRPNITRTRARARTQHVPVCAAGPHRRSVHLCSQPRMDIDTCMQCVYIHCVCASHIDGWPYEESASHSHRCRVLAHRQRPHAIARVCKNAHAHPFTCPDFAPIKYIFMYDMCVGNICRRTYPRAHVMATAASSARAIAPTCASGTVQPHARPYPSLAQEPMYLICICIYLYMHMYIHIHIHKYIYI